MSDFGTEETDVYVLELSYGHGHHGHHGHHLGRGGFGIGTRDAEGNWSNAVDRNYGGTKAFYLGEWKPEYGLGSYGVDPCSKTVWAVLNYNADFAAANGIEPAYGHDRGNLREMGDQELEEVHSKKCHSR
jgi:hypothetical protein